MHLNTLNTALWQKILLSAFNLDKSISIHLEECGSNFSSLRFVVALLAGLNLLDISIGINLDAPGDTRRGVIPSLNSRLYLIKRLKNHLNADRLKKVADGIWTSKLRYGLQLYGKVRTSDTDPTNSTIKKLQTAQNKLARVLENVYLRDRMCTKKLLSNQEMLSVNQVAAQIKLTEMWKANNVDKYSIKVTKQTTAENARVTRGDTSERLIETGMSDLVRNSCLRDATKLWNKAPLEVKTAKSIISAKKEIKKFASTLPI